MNESVPHRLYRAFAARDWRTVGALYADDAVFNDPAFVNLNADQVRAMWRMLFERGKDMTVTFVVHEDTPQSARVTWTARYTFSQTGRKVVNVINADLQLRDGLIVRHTDTFDFHRWSSQALGLIGALAGWSGWLREKVSGKAMAGLRQFMERNPSR